jgi:hypothetical protein
MSYQSQLSEAKNFQTAEKTEASTNSYGQTFMMQTTTSDPEYDEENIWYVDTGATDHIAKYIEYFAEYEAFSTPWKVKVGNKRVHQCQGTWDNQYVLSGQWQVAQQPHNQWLTIYFQLVLQLFKVLPIAQRIVSVCF